LLDFGAFDEDSVDLRLGTHFLMPQIPPEPFIDPNSPDKATLSYLSLHIPLGSYFALPAHQTVLGATFEFIKLPFDASGQIFTKSSVARTFMLIETAPWIHPLYRGCLTLEIANVSNTTIILYPGMPLGHLILLDTPCDKAPERLSGTYVGPIHPEAPKLKQPSTALGIIGVQKFKHPFYGWMEEEKMLEELRIAWAALNSSQQGAVHSMVDILKAYGGIPQDNPALKIVKR
jgi:dCTP deaminase